MKAIDFLKQDSAEAFLKSSPVEKPVATPDFSQPIPKGLEEPGLVQPVYDPIDTFIDAFTLGGPTVVKQLIKQGPKILAKQAAKEVATGAGVGAGMAIADELGGGEITKFLAGLGGGTITSAGITAARQGIIRALLKKGVPKDTVELQADNLVQKYVKTSLETADTNESAKALRQKYERYSKLISEHERPGYEQWWEDALRIREMKRLGSAIPIEGKPLRAEEYLEIKTPRKGFEKTAPDLARPTAPYLVQPAGQNFIEQAQALVSRTPEKLAKAVGKPKQIDTLRQMGKKTERELVEGIVQDAVEQPKKLAELARSKGKLKLAEQLESQAIENGMKIKTADGEIADNAVDRVLQPLRGERGAITIQEPKAKKIAREMAEDPDIKAVSSLIGKEKKPTVFETLAKANQKLFDRFAPIKKVSKQAYEEALTYSSHKDAINEGLERLKDSMKKVSDQPDLFGQYMLAHRAKTRLGAGITTAITEGKADRAIKKIEKIFVDNGYSLKDVHEARDAFQKWTHDEILKPMRDANIISDEAYNAIKDKNKWYMTFDVLDHMPDDLDKLPVRGEWFSVGKNKVIMRMRGTEKQIAEPLEATIRKMIQARNTIARNNIASMLVETPGVARIRANSIKEFKSLKNAVGPGYVPKRDEDVIHRLINGKAETYIVDKTIADAMKNLSPKSAFKSVMAINSVFRQAATTVYLPFTISNMFRDAFMAYTTAPVYKATRPDQFAVDWVKGALEGVKHEFLGKSKLAKEYIEKGGSFGWVGHIRTARDGKAIVFKSKSGKDVVANIIKFPKHIRNLLEKISSSVELAPRLGVYDRAIKQGLSKREAALLARKSTIDFNRGGITVKQLNQWIPFLNARVQGRLNVAEALGVMGGGTTAQRLARFKQTAPKIFTAVIIPGMATYAYNRYYYPEQHDDIPEYIRQNYYPIIIGEETGRTGEKEPKYLVIPKGDVGQVFWNPFEYALDSAYGRDKSGFNKWAINFLSDVSPVDFAREGQVSPSKMLSSVSPPFVKAVVEPITNYNLYKGRAVEPDWMRQKYPEELRAYDWTPESYKVISQKLKDYTGSTISPLKLQNIASNLLAGYGREGLSIQAMIGSLTGRIVRTQGGEIRNRATETIKDMEQGYKTARAFAEQAVLSGNRKEAADIMNAWNASLERNLSEYNKEFSKYDLQDRGKLRQSLFFSFRKKLNVMKKKKDTRSYIEKKLRK